MRPLAPAAANPALVRSWIKSRRCAGAIELSQRCKQIKSQFDIQPFSVSKALPDPKLSPMGQPLLAHQPETATDAFLYFRAERKMVKVFVS
ncbi:MULTISPECIES: hypothetical protein [unclassified Spirosoma]|uniref:hypothetical protein n=1 Tax=unclassified Spirosoma TaxID=2621999 RepID=UPI00095BBE6E|nr:MULTISPECIES: hypothetical protein [unclassified Spirosoma]MBN8826528.1 hypothetical protein [Spirosoma sp.]OJW71618.1 MAG: hypothetical protein BGO59_26970 [Spirosoma sp. 48-14]